MQRKEERKYTEKELSRSEDRVFTLGVLQCVSQYVAVCCSMCCSVLQTSRCVTVCVGCRKQEPLRVCLKRALYSIKSDVLQCVASPYIQTEDKYIYVYSACMSEKSPVFHQKRCVAVCCSVLHRPIFRQKTYIYICIHICIYISRPRVNALLSEVAVRGRVLLLFVWCQKGPDIAPNGYK